MMQVLNKNTMPRGYAEIYSTKKAPIRSLCNFINALKTVALT